MSASVLVSPSVASASVSPLPPAATSVELPTRILLPSSLDAFTADAWSARCRAHGFEVITSAGEGNCVVVVPVDVSPAALDATVQTYFATEKKKSSFKNVHLVSSVVFDESKLGAFPASIAAYRAVGAKVVVCSTSVPTTTKTALTQCIQAIGGRLDGSYTSKVTTHLIAAKAMSQKYAAATRQRRHVCSEQWVFDCFRLGQLVDEGPFRVPTLRGCVLTCIGVPAAEAEECKQLVEQNGGQYVESLSSSPAPTHIISSYPVPEGIENPKTNAVVSRVWLDESLADPGSWRETKDFPVLSPAARVDKEEVLARKREQDKLEKRRQEEAAVREKKESRAKALRRESQAQAEAAQRARDDEARVLAEQEAQRMRVAEAELAVAEAARKETEVLYDSSNDLYLQGLQIFLLGLDNAAQTEQAHKIIRFGGGTRLQSLQGRDDLLHAHANSNCTNMVLVYGCSCRREVLDHLVKVECRKGVDAITFPIVNFKWLADCYKQKAIAPFAGYELPPPSIDAALPSAHTPTAGLFNARGPSPAPGMVRTGSSLSRGVLQRGNSTPRQNAPTPDVLDVSVTVDATVLAAEHGGPEDGPTNFAFFNQSLKSTSKPQTDTAATFAERSAAGLSTAVASLRRSTSSHISLPPPGPNSNGGPVLMKMAAAALSSTGRPLNLFQGLRFVVEDHEADSEDAEGGERKLAADSILPLLRFTTKHRLTVLKQLQDYGATFIHEVSALRSVSFKNQMDYIIGSVCGSPQRTPRDFQATYGNKAQFVSYMWVTACIKSNRILPILPPADLASNVCWSGQVPRLTTDTPPVKGFNALTVTCSGFSAEEAEVIIVCVKHGGAAYTPELRRASTQCIYRDASTGTAASPLNVPGSSTTQPNLQAKRSSACKWQVPVVRGVWLAECLARCEFMSEDPYLIPPTPEMLAAAGRRSTRQSSTPIAVPDSPMMMMAPDTPASVLAVTTPTPLPPSHFEPPPSATKPKATRASKRRSTSDIEEEGTIDSAVDDDDDDLGFGLGIQSALTHAPPIATPEVRSKRGRSSAAATTSAATTSRTSEVTTPSSVASVDLVDDDATAADKALSKKAQFQQSLKQQSAKPSKTSHSKRALAAVDEGPPDDGEAEAFVDFKPTAVAPPAPVAKADDDVFSLDADSEVEEPAARPFRQRKSKGGAAAGVPSPAAAAPVSLATASGIVAPILRTSPKKQFVKFRASRAPDTPPATPPTRPEPVAQAPPVTPAVSDLASEATTPSSVAPVAAAAAAPANRVRRRIQVSQDPEDSAALDTGASELASAEAAEPEPEPEPEATPEKVAPKKASKTKVTRGKQQAAEPIQEEQPEKNGAHVADDVDATEAAATKTPAKASSRQSARSTPKAAPAPAAATPRSSRAKKAPLPTPEEKPPAEAVADAVAVPEKSEAPKSPVKPAAAAPRVASPAKAAIASPGTPVKKATRTRTPASRSKAAPPLRSPSLGGGPESSIDHPLPKKRAPAPKKTYGKNAVIASQNEDPFEFSCADDLTEKPQLTETQVLTEKPHLSPVDEAAQATSAIVAAAPVVTPGPAGRSRRRAAASAKSYADVGSEGEEEDAVAPAAAEPTAKLTPATKKVTAAASKKKRTKAEIAAEEEEEEATKLAVTEFSITPPPSPKRAAAPLPAPIPTASPPAPRSAPKRKTSPLADEQPEPPAASPLKRTLSLKAVDALSALKADSDDAASAHAEEEEEAASPKKRAKREAVPSKKKKALAAAEQDEEMDTAAKRPASKAASKVESVPTIKPNKRGRKDESTTSEEAPPKRAKKADTASTPTPSSSSPPSKKWFTLTGVPSADKPRYMEVITSLGGEVVPDHKIDFRKVTHIVCQVQADEGLKRSEKVLVALMGKHSFLDISFLDACKKAARFVDESKYEWVRHGAESDAMMPALRKWRKGAESPYAGWRIATIDVEQSKLDFFKNLLTSGGGCLVDRDDRAVTHILLNTSCATQAALKKKSKHAHEAVLCILAAQADPSSVIVAGQDYLADYLVQIGVGVSAIPFQLVTATASRCTSAASTPAASPLLPRKASNARGTKAKDAEKLQDTEMADAEDEEDRDAVLPIDRSIRHSARRKR